jgi:hypothetical protein
MSSSNTTTPTASSVPPQPAAAAPTVDNRDLDKIMEEFTGLVPYYLAGEWDISAENNLGAAGIALAKIFAEILENVIVRLNKLPERTLIEFLNNIGVNLTPAIPATAPVTIALSEKVNQDVRVYAATKLATEATDKHDPLTFETSEEMLVTASKLIEVYSFVNTKDAIYRHTNAFATRQSFFLFDGNESKGRMGNLQEHFLYLGHPDLFNIKSNAIKITLKISTQYNKDLKKLAAILNDTDANGAKIISWEYNWKIDEAGIQTGVDRFSVLAPASVRAKKIAITLTKPESKSQIQKLKVNGVESCWIRCKLIYLDDLKLKQKYWTALNPPFVKNIEIVIESVKPVKQLDNITPDALAYNEVPLNINNVTDANPLYPFGKKPATLDSFYIASQDAFSKRGAKLLLSFSFIPSPTANNILTTLALPSTSVTIILTGSDPNLGGLKFYIVNPPHYGALSPTTATSTSYGVKYAPWFAGFKGTDSFTYKVIDHQGRSSNIATVTIALNNPPIPPPPPPPPIPTFNSPSAILSWEYWNGKGWSSINTIHTHRHRTSVSFTCPLDISPVHVSGNENYWIRVRIVSGDYGKIEQTSTTSSSGNVTWSEDDSNIQEPQLNRLPTIKIVPSKPSKPEQCSTYNNLEYDSAIDSNGSISPSFQPFKGMEDAHPTIYLGYDKKMENGPINLMFSLKDREFPAGSKRPMFDFNYYSKDIGQTANYVEKKISAVDGTGNLTKTGSLKFYIGPDFAQRSNFGNDLFWIKAVDTTDVYADNIKQIGTSILPPEVKTLYHNTVTAIHATKVSDEILGSSSGLPNQTFNLTKTPVSLGNFNLRINEGTFLSDEDRTALLRTQTIQDDRDQAGNLIASWVSWNRVDDMYDSGPNDRDFRLDTTLGIIEFGDDIKGKIPPIGSDNIKTTYIAADNAVGIALPGEIKSLKSNIPFIDSVTNPEVEGGMASETTDNALLRGPQLLRNRGQAVTANDFEWLVREKFPILARVKCLPTTSSAGVSVPGHTSMVIVQTSTEEKPIPSLELLGQVQQHLASLSSTVIASNDQLKVMPPAYVIVSVTADIYPISTDLASVARNNASDVLTAFLHPLLGGFDGKGWDFGYLVSQSDIFRILSNISEIDHIGSVSIAIEDGVGNLQVRTNTTTVLPQALMCSGDHNLSVVFRGR